MYARWHFNAWFHNIYHAHLKGAGIMTRRSRLLATILAVLVVLIAVAASGCANGQNVFKRTQDGRLEYKEGSDVWTWDHKGSSTQITLNDKLFAVLQNRAAQVSLPNGNAIDVTMDNSGAPTAIKAAWGVVLTQQDYTQMNTAFSIQKMAGVQGPSGSFGWAIFLLLLIVGGVFLFIYAGSLVNSAKVGGIFNGTDTAKTLLIFRAGGIFVVVVSAIILLAVIF
jgi:hypothetical protein